MNRLKAFGLTVAGILMASLTITGCGGSQQTANTNSTASLVDDNATATLNVWGYWNDFKTLQDLVKKKFPNVTLVQIGNSKENLTDVASKQENPDIIYQVGANHMPYLYQTGFNYDLTPLIQKYKVNMNGYYPSALSNLNRYSTNNQTVALPALVGHNVMLYNKDIFDKFGVSYPTNGMTWQQVIDLAKKVSGDKDGVHYSGLMLQDFSYISNEYPLMGVDSKTDTSTLLKDSRWTDLFNLYKSVYSPENYNPDTFKRGINAFAIDKNVAMYVNAYAWYHIDGYKIYDGYNQVEDPQFQKFNWDMVADPVLSQNPKQGNAIDFTWYSVSPQSNNKDIAFKVIAYLTTSTEVNDFYASTGPEPVTSAYNVPGEDKLFGSNFAPLKDKNVGALFYNSPAIWPKDVSKYEYIAAPIINKDINLILSGTDVNTALRQADDEINKAIITARQTN